MMSQNFKEQVRLLLDVLPIATTDNRVALKGGTAINLFVQDFPRLSVDIDLVYLALEDRGESLQNMNNIMKNIANTINESGTIKANLKLTKEGIAKQILVTRQITAIKIELNLVIRGSLYAPTYLELSKKTQNEFQKYMAIQCLQFEELYAGKFCAALDRAHPRDLFDLIVFFKDNIITEKLKNAFIGYLLSSNRPIYELLNPNPNKDLSSLFDSEFHGMIDDNITIEMLENARVQLVSSLQEAFNENDRKFLISFKEGEPIWDLCSLNLKDMPSIKWKLHNIKNMSKDKHEAMLKKLRNYLMNF